MTSAFGGQHSIQLSYGCIADTRNTVRITDFADKAKQKAVSFAQRNEGVKTKANATVRRAKFSPSHHRLSSEHRSPQV